ncbi:MAG: 23S rRNA (guanosine(2251)-2'-O)-methyltransferase RlmB [Gammaproteobacteria bacterium]|nr:23S rRNA (guanosine(2251)-2'-O)-methyltransferase RlmB [Gammaproteobacteria bacterium]
MAATELIFGQHAVREVLERSPELVLGLMIARGADSPRMQALVEAAQQFGIHADRAARSKLDQLAGGGRHQGIVARVRSRPARSEDELARLLDALDEPPLLLALDGVTDPRNLGACLRTADAGGVHAVIAPRDRAAGLTPAARKAACGAAESVPFFQVTNLARSLRRLKDADVSLLGAAEDAPASLYAADLTGALCLVLGAEGRGLRRLSRELCDRMVALPMRGSVESLNVAVAAGVLIYEARRQRDAKRGHS